MSRPLRYTIFTLMYFVQGAVVAYFTALNSLYLLSFDLTMSEIGLIGTIALIPFVLKIFLGMLSDRVSLFRLGHRKPYMLIGLLIQAACLFIVPLIRPDLQYWLFALLAFLLMTGQALYDTCTDGLALDTTSESEQGTIQGLMVGARALGVVILSSLVGIVVEKFSWNVMFMFLGIMSLLPIPLVFSIKEPQRSESTRFQWTGFSAFANISVIGLAILGALYSFTTNGANQIINPSLTERFNISYSLAGFFTTLWGIGVILGALTGGRLVDRIGQKRAVIFAIALSVVTILSLAFIKTQTVAYLLVAIFGIAFGYYETVYFAMAMRLTDPRIAASMFAILMAIANIGTGIGLGVSGSLVDSVGYSSTFIIIALLNLLGFLLLPIIFRKQPAVASEA